MFHILWSEFTLLLVDFFRQTWETESGTTNMQFILKKEPYMVKIGDKLKSLRSEKKMT